MDQRRKQVLDLEQNDELGRKALHELAVQTVAQLLPSSRDCSFDYEWTSAPKRGRLMLLAERQLEGK